MLDPFWRRRALSRLDRTFDLVIIGAGITGCGIALDAAQRGLRVLLIDKGDIASGTSSRSSKLIHGGLRYLKQMQLRITRQACRERDRLLTLSPHVVRPIRFLYPAYHGDRTPGWQVDFGLWMYDRLTGRPEKHTQLGAEEAESLAPGLATGGLDRALVFTDAVADDARLTLTVAATAHANGAAVLTRCEVAGALRNRNGRIHGLVVTDLESGRSHRVSCRVVINATGVWVDTVRDRLGLEGSHLRPSRGAHVILPTDLLPLKVAVSLLSPDDGRPVFLIPHPEGVLLGTTDLYHHGELDDPRPTLEEIDYLLRAAAAGFPQHNLTRDVVRGAFAGVRPILDTYADNPAEASREDDIWEEDGLLSVAGGKLTTWRSTAEIAVDSAMRLLPEERARHASSCHTRGTALVGLAPRGLAAALEQNLGILAPVADGMSRRLGATAWTAALLARKPRELTPLDDGLDLSAAEVRAHLRYSAVLHLDDLLLRRVRIGMWSPDRVHDLLPALRPLFADELGIGSRQWPQELERLERHLAGWTLAGARQDVAGPDTVTSPPGESASDAVSSQHQGSGG